MPWMPRQMSPGRRMADCWLLLPTIAQVWNVWQGSNKQGRLVSSYQAAANGVLSWSPKGQYLATASGNNVILFDASSGALLYIYTASTTAPIATLAWSPDGSLLASGSNLAAIWSA